MSDEKTFWIVLKWMGADEPMPLTAQLTEEKARYWAAEAVLECHDGEYLTITQTVPQEVIPATMESLGWRQA